MSIQQISFKKLLYKFSVIYLLSGNAFVIFIREALCVYQDTQTEYKTCSRFIFRLTDRTDRQTLCYVLQHVLTISTCNRSSVAYSMNFFSSILVFLKSIALAAIHYISIRCVGVIKIRVTNSLLSVDFPQEREETENDIFVPFTFFLLRLSLLFLSSL